jgi:hypothetical protein
MSDREHMQAAPPEEDPAASAPADASEVPAPPAAQEGARQWRTVAVGLAAAFLLVIGLVAAAPLWAPLLPWATADDQEVQLSLVARLDRLEAAQAQSPQQFQRQQQQVQQTAAETKTALERLAQRLTALEGRPAASNAAPDIGELRQQLAKSSRSASDLTARLEAVERRVREQTARDAGDAALVLGLLQIRGAVQQGRPFAAEYEAFSALARGRPEIAEAAAPLAEPAKTGVVAPAVLAKRLRDLAGGIAAAGVPAPPPDAVASGWGEAALARLRGLVTIRRVGEGPPEGAAAAINAAALALAGGDLAAAIAAIEKLTGAPAEAAAPWLRMARQRAAVDSVLRRLEALATARLGSPGPAPGLPG